MKFQVCALWAAVFIFILGAEIARSQTVTTDQQNYSPGSTVYISGSGFAPGETVQLQVVNVSDPSDTGEEHAPWTVTADAGGNITTTWYVTSDEAGADLQLTAQGLTSGLTAQETFTDGSIIGVNAGPQTGTLTYGTVSTATYDISFSNSGNGSYSGLNVSGLPSGVTFDLTATAGSGHPPADQTLTVTNGATTPAGTYTITIATTSPTLSTTATLTIGQRSVTITGVSAAGKTYDGATTATLSGGSVSGAVNGDTVTFTAGTGNFASKFVGTWAVTASGYALSATGVSTNYTLSAQPTVANATISAKGVTITGVTASGKTYDSTTTATLNNGSAAISGAVGSDAVTFTTGTGVFSSKNAGTWAMTASGYALSTTGISTNYTLSAQPTVANATISARPLTVTAGSSTKVYNATTSSTNIPIVSSGVLQGSDAPNFSVTYDTKNTGSGKTLTPAGTVSDGNSGANYSYTFVTSASGVINKTNLTVTAQANTKPYDGGTSSAVNAAITAGGIQTGDTAPTWTQTYNTKNVGSGKTLTPSSLVVTDGSSGNNYNYTYTAIASGVINKTNLTVTAQANTKVYDGGTSSAANATITAGGIQTGDIAPTWTQTYDTKNVGTGKTLTPSSLVVTDGNSGNNYSYTYTASAVGTINKTNLTVTAQANTKVYDGGTSSVTNAAITAGGIQTGDTAPTWTQSYDTKNVGSGKTLTPSSLVVTDGNSGNNYNYTYATSAVGTINGKVLSITASNQSKTYGVALNLGTTAFSVGSGLIAGESVTAVALIANGGTNATDTVGSYIITPSAATGTGGFAAGNYSLTYLTGILTVNQAGTSVAVASSENPSGYKDAIDFLASLPSDATGSVIFLTNSTPFSTNTLSGGGATSASTTLLPRGTSTVTVQYAGNVNYIGSTNILSGGQIVTNHPPVAGNATLTRSVNSIKIFVSNLLTNVTDVDGDTISLTAVGTSTNGVTPSTNPSLIIYNNANGVNDQFTYTVSDGNGGSATGTVNVVFSPFAVGQNATVTPVAGIAKVHYQAIPNYHYSIQRSTNMIAWTTILTTNAAPNGALDHNDDFSDLGGLVPSSAFYRLVWMP